jgi:hypothetical protein
MLLVRHLWLAALRVPLGPLAVDGGLAGKFPVGNVTWRS